MERRRGRAGAVGRGNQTKRKKQDCNCHVWGKKDSGIENKSGAKK